MSDREIILFHYPFSPYARRIVWYLALRKIPYSSCIQPPYLPRPDLRAVGTVYRRIPVCSIGKDIYNDTRAILSALEKLFPASSSYPSISSSDPAQKATEKLLEYWAVDAGVFVRAAQLIPASTKILTDDKFKKDREDFSGRSWSHENVELMRPEALVEMRGAFSFLEEMILGDGREWVLGSEGPSLADIEGVWPLHWLTTLPGALPENFISPKHFPRVFSWISRFSAAVKGAKNAGSKPQALSGADALKQISSSEFSEAEGEVEVQDPTGLKKGQLVEVWPIDSGFNHKDRGPLIALSGAEIVIESRTQEGTVVRVHTPRHGFRVRGVEGNGSRL